SIRERLGKSSDKIFSGSTAAPAPPDISINLDFKTKFDTFRKFVKTTDFLNGVLGLFAAACLLGALVISRRRRRLLMVFSVAVLIFALLQLIGTNAVRPAVLNHVQNEAYRPAVGVIYDNLLANFRHSALVVALVSAIVFAAALLSQKRFINKSKFLADQLKQYKSTKLYREWKKFRKLVNQYKLHISGVVIILGLAVMALAFNLDWQGIIRSVLAVIIILELVFLAAARRRRGRV
ncbi:MAG TPA: hypothetical protein VFW52_00440, partial [Candidatus Saccharimonadales bacterium]|nr:hypothetical protein [Candidatus Saccharimonadales bacterium]